MEKAVATIYDGEPEGLAEFAEVEFGYTFEGHEHPFARQISNEQRRIDEIGNTAGSVGVPGRRLGEG